MPDQLELKVKLITEGLEKMDQILASTKAIEDAVGKASSSLDEMQKHLKQVGDQAGEAGDGFKKFAEGVKNFIENPLHAAGEMAESFLNKLGPMGVAAGAAGAALATIGIAASETIKSLGEMATRIEDVKIRTGFTTEQVGQFSFAAKLAGTDIGTFEMGMRMLSQALSDNSEMGKRAKTALESVGISSRDTFGHLVPTSEMFVQISEALNRMTSTSERTAFAISVFGRAGSELLPVLMDLKHSLEVARKANADFMSDEEIAKAKKYAESLALVQSGWEAIKRATEEAFVANVVYWGEMAKHVAGGIVGAGNAAAQGNGARVLASFDMAHLPTEPGLDARLSIPGYDFETKQRGKSVAATALGAGTLEDHLAAAQARQATALAAVQKLQSSNTMLTPGGGEASATKPDQDRIAKEYKDSTAAVTASQAAIDARKAAEDAVGKSASFLAALANKDANPVERLFNDLEAHLKTPGLTTGMRQSATTATMDAVAGEFLKQREGIGDDQDREAQERTLRQISTQKASAKYGADQAKMEPFDDRGVEAPWHIIEERARKKAAANRQIDSIGAGADREGLERQARRAGATAQAQIPLGSGTAGQEQGINDAYNIRLDLAQKIQQVDLDRAGKEIDVEKQRIDMAKARADYTKQSQDAEIEKEEKLLDLDRQRKEAARSLTGGIFDAITAKDPGTAMRNFFIGQAKNVGSSVFSNILQPAFEPIAGTIDTLKSAGTTLGGTTQHGQIGGLAGLLGGGVPGALTPDNTSRKANTDAVSMLTVATNELTKALTYVATGGTSGSLSGGAIAPGSAAGGIPGAGNLGSLGVLASYGGGAANYSGPGSLFSGGYGSGYGVASVPGAANYSGPGSLFDGGYGAAGDVSDLSDLPLGMTAPLAKSAQLAATQTSSIGSAVKTFSDGLAKISGGANSPFTQFGQGAGTIASGNAVGTIMGSYSPASDGTDPTAARIGAGIGLAGATYAGVTSALHDFSKGGGQGIAQGIGAIAGTAAAWDPEPISHAVLSGIALVSTMVGTIFGDPKAERTAQINHELANNAYNSTGYIDSRGNYVPGAQARSISYFGASGGESYDTNFQGGIRGGSFASTTRNMYDPSGAANQLRNGYVAPPAGTPIDEGLGYGNQSGTGPFQRPITQGGRVVGPQPMVIQVQAMDSKSFLDHASEISSALRLGIQQGHPVVQEMQQALNPR